MPKAVEKDSMEELIRKKKNVDFSVYENGKSNLGSCQSLLDPIRSYSDSYYINDIED